jgi:acetyltransferase-like isoleucine patch superfamily enzyme
MKLKQVLGRFLKPPFVVTAIYLLKNRVMASPRAEVELSDRVEIGKGAVFSSFTQVKTTGGGRLKIGEKVNVGIGAHIVAGPGGVTIGEKCLISQNVCIEGVNYRYDRLDLPFMEQEQTSKGITIERNVWVGANCVVLDGAHIEEGSIITPGSVVQGRIKANSIASGNPAKRIFTRR